MLRLLGEALVELGYGDRDGGAMLTLRADWLKNFRAS